MEDEAPLLPLYSRSKQVHWFQLRFPTFALVTVGLPFTAFAFCVYYSTQYNFRESTATHCQVDNYLPSVSAAIGSFSPQKHVWMIAIILHFLPRIAIASLYRSYLLSVLEPSSQRLVKVTWLLNFIEVSCLLGLTLVSSTFFYPAHATFFMLFIVTSIVYMLCCCYLLSFRRLVSASSRERVSLRFKWILFFVNLAGFLLAGYCFVRHNRYCEAGVYSLFAIFEYVVVVSNMAFHLTAYYDFYNKVVYIASTGISFS